MKISEQKVKTQKVGNQYDNFKTKLDLKNQTFQLTTTNIGKSFSTYPETDQDLREEATEENQEFSNNMEMSDRVRE